MQWASSMAKNAGRGALQPLEEAGHDQPLGRDEEQPDAAAGQPRASTAARSAGVWLLLSTRGRHAAWRRPSTWSFISAISGETTTVRRPQVGGGRLVAERLAAAGGQHDERVAAVEHAGDGLVLQREEAVVAPDATDRLVQELSLDDGAMIADAARRA